MTEVNGLRLAYRGFVTGLAAGYAWLATAMLVGGLLHGDPLAALRPVAAALLRVTERSIGPELAFVLALTLGQLAGGLIGMCFAYFFARFFTDRRTLAGAAACFAILVWALLTGWVAATMGRDLTLQLGIGAGSVAYGVLLGLGVPRRGEVLRRASPA